MGNDHCQGKYRKVSCSCETIREFRVEHNPTSLDSSQIVCTTMPARRFNTADPEVKCTSLDFSRMVCAAMSARRFNTSDPEVKCTSPDSSRMLCVGMSARPFNTVEYPRESLSGVSSMLTLTSFRLIFPPSVSSISTNACPTFRRRLAGPVGVFYFVHRGI